jgi:ABC-type lipoprotein export system ATPase subunit
MNPTTCIQLKNITKTYTMGDSTVFALRDVSLEITAGDCVAIMGPSGSGKSTLMHILGALDTPTSGTYKLDGHDVSKLSQDELAQIRREQIGFVFQSFNLLKKTKAMRESKQKQQRELYVTQKGPEIENQNRSWLRLDLCVRKASNQMKAESPSQTFFYFHRINNNQN